MRILTVSAFYESHGGGIEVVAGALARALARRGHDCCWVAAGFDAPPSSDELTVIPLHAFDPIEKQLGLPMPLLACKGRSTLAREITRADAVIVHDALYASSLLAARHARRLGKPLVLIQHIGAIPYRNPLLRAALFAANGLITRPLLARAGQTVFISAQVRDHFADANFAASPLLMFNGVDHECFHPVGPEERVARRAELGFDVSSRHLLFVGRFVERKGLAVIAQVARSRPDWTIHMVGGGPMNPAAWSLPNVRLLGRRNAGELAALYQAADTLLLPSTGEGFPLVVQEAMACGLPVACGLDSAEADPDAARFLTGVPVDPKRPGETAARFIRALAGMPLGPQVAAAAYAARTYDWDANAARIEARVITLASHGTTGRQHGCAASQRSSAS